jgi:hypothetical protein
VLLPGQGFTEKIRALARLSHRRLLYCNLRYLKFSDEIVAGQLYLREQQAKPRPDAMRYLDVFVRVTERKLPQVSPASNDYVLRLRQMPSSQVTHLVRRRVRMQVTPRSFSLQDALTRARPGAEAHTYFTAAGAWVFDYGPDGTWVVGPVATTKLSGRYLPIITDLERLHADSLTLVAAKRDPDPLLDVFERSGYPIQTTDDKMIEVSIPAADVVSVLEQAEALSYTIDGVTWHLTDTTPPTPDPSAGDTTSPG